MESEAGRMHTICFGSEASRDPREGSPYRGGRPYEASQPSIPFTSSNDDLPASDERDPGKESDAAYVSNYNLLSIAGKRPGGKDWKCSPLTERAANKHNKIHKRGLLDILDVHACIGSEIKIDDHDEKLDTYRGGKPYLPSLMSIPFSSLSEDSNLNQSATKKIYGNNSDPSVVLVETELKSENTKKKESTDLGKDHMLIDDSRMIHSTVRTKKTVISHTLPDILPEKSDNSLELEQESVMDFLPNTTMAFSVIELSKGKEMSYQMDDSIIRLFEERRAECFNVLNTDKEEYIALRQKTRNLNLNNHTMRNMEHTKSQLRLFDSSKYPLTDSDDNILKNVEEQRLVHVKSGEPFWDYYSKILFDQNGMSSISMNFQPCASSKSNFDSISPICLYDFRGYPLTDYNGLSLATATGKKLIVTDEKGNLLHDSNGNPIFDGAGIPLTKAGGCWLNPRGTPYRVFDMNKRPLTDLHGRAILKVNNEELLKCDEHGRPVLDCDGRYVLDRTGRMATDPEFDPSMPVENEGSNTMLLNGTEPIQIYDDDDFPLTNADGIVLKDSSGNCLLNIDYLRNCDLPGTSNLRLAKIKRSPNNNGDSRNIRKFDFRDSEMHVESEIYTQIEDYSSDFDKNKENQNNEGTESAYFDENTIPVPADQEAFTNFFKSYSGFISEASSDFLNNSSDSTLITEDNLEQEFEEDVDIFGRPLYDREGIPCFDKYGRPLRDLFLRPLYDEQGNAITTANGKLLSNGECEMPGVHPGFDTNYLTLHDSEKLLNLRDRNGGPIHDDSGKPLYNAKGKPLYDAFGRPLYNRNGFPLCDEEGFPASEAVQEKGLKIVDVMDTFEELRVQNQDIPSLKEPRHGNTKKCYRGENEHALRYRARVRITTFVNGEKVMELLELTPPFGDNMVL